MAKWGTAPKYLDTLRFEDPINILSILLLGFRESKTFILCSLLIYMCKVCVGTSVKKHVRSNAGLDHGNLLESKGHVSTYSA